MDKDYLVKYGAQQGDVFVLLKQAETLEMPAILEDLQRQYGGRIRFSFHITCQRFVCSDELLLEVVDRLEPTLKSI